MDRGRIRLRFKKYKEGVSQLGEQRHRMVIKGSLNKKLQYYASLPYTIIIERWDGNAGPYWVARVAELHHCMIHADTPEEAVRGIEEVKRDWLKSNLERGLPIPEPRPQTHSGQIRLRTSPSLHKMLAYQAEIEGMSLNQYMATALAMSVGLSAPRTRAKKVEKSSRGKN